MKIYLNIIKRETQYHICIWQYHICIWHQNNFVCWYVV